MRRLLLAWVLLLVGTAMAVASNAQAEDSPQARAIVRSGTIEAGLVTGYLQGNGTFTSLSSNRSALYVRSEEHTSELQSRLHLVCRLLLEKKEITRRPTKRSN